MTEFEKAIKKSTSRHIARLLSDLTIIGVNEDVIEKCRKEMWFLSNDLVDITKENIQVIK